MKLSPSPPFCTRVPSPSPLLTHPSFTLLPSCSRISFLISSILLFSRFPSAPLCLCLLGLQLPDNIRISGAEWQHSGKVHGGLLACVSPALSQLNLIHPPCHSALVQTLSVHGWPSLCSLSQMLQPRPSKVPVQKGTNSKCKQRSSMIPRIILEKDKSYQSTIFWHRKRAYILLWHPATLPWKGKIEFS